MESNFYYVDSGYFCNDRLELREKMNAHFNSGYDMKILEGRRVDDRKTDDFPSTDNRQDKDW